MYECTWSRHRCNMCDAPLNIIIIIDTFEEMLMVDEFYEKNPLDMSRNAKVRAYLHKPCFICSACSDHRKAVRAVQIPKFVSAREYGKHNFKFINRSVTQSELHNWWEDFKKFVDDNGKLSDETESRTPATRQAAHTI